ncbi:MAG: hypothetical protein AB8H79_24910, partial [Myxococcota bacterium]
PADFEAMLEATKMYDNERDIKRQVHNMEIVQALMAESDGRMTPNELFKAFNTTKLNEATGGDHEEHPAFQTYQDQELKGSEDGRDAYDTESATYENMGRFGTEQAYEGDAWMDSQVPRQGGYEALDAMNEMRRTTTESDRDIDARVAHEEKKWKRKKSSPFASKKKKKALDAKYGNRVANILSGRSKPKEG